MDHLIIVKHENDLIKHLMEPRERGTRNLGWKTFGRHRTGGKDVASDLSLATLPPLCARAGVSHWKRMTGAGGALRICKKKFLHLLEEVSEFCKIKSKRTHWEMETDGFLFDKWL